MRPNLKILQEFTNSYLPHKPPTIQWKKLRSAVGQAHRKSNIIYLKPNASLNSKGCKVGRTFYMARRKLKLKEGEQYFLILLHEIAHFKIIDKPLKEWVSLKKKLWKEAKKRIKIKKQTRKKLGEKPLSKEEEKRALWGHVCYEANLKRRKGESNSNYFGRNENFQSWLYGDIITEHIAVEDWARKEFIKQRKKIHALLPTGKTKRKKN